ncbi:MAG: UvrD-helicase domain-containing protein [Verrucomicrobia bacterium]|nr:UvrD-helicase domain-containing protein [Verrucomicrobiota bacterium]
MTNTPPPPQASGFTPHPSSLPPSPLSHQAISASAGSGKTFRLAHRYIRLMAEGVPPDRICALTFSRKAAGEIFDSIVEYLCKAASDPNKAKETATHIERPGLDCAQFGALLQTFLNNLHRMHIGTLDSFMIGVAKAFPSELGIPTEFQVMDSDGSQAVDMREAILAGIFDPQISATDVQREFIHAFKQATFGQEEKTLGSRLDRFIGDNRDHFQLCPLPALWGQPETIGLSNHGWVMQQVDAAQAAEDMLAAIDAVAPSNAIRERFITFASLASEFQTGTPWPKDIEYMFNRLVPEMPALRRGDATVKIGRAMFEIPPEACRAALTLVQHIIHSEVNASLKRTAGLFQILALYNAHYSEHLQQTGRMTFNDAQVLLTDANPASGGALISRQVDTPGKLYIDYRLDCKLDHWLLDEFQDTSDLQWAVLKNLADEILQDNSGERSFFYVGDVKQAIYAWRGGNARLFNRILNRYGDRIQRVPMNVSFRSCPAIIDTVNAIFEDVTPDDGLHPDAVTAWRDIWEHHESAEHLKKDAGYAALLEPAEPAYGNRFCAADRYDVVAAILNDMQPTQRKLDVAVLVMSNKAGYEVVDHLRRTCPGIPIVHEGNTTILDNPVVALLLALLQVASHPGDTFAWKHIQMSPLPAALVQSPGALSLDMLKTVHTHGFQAAIRHWATILDSQRPLDEFGNSRLEDLIEAAASFDETGSRDVDAFLRFAEAHQVKELAASRAVRVMTVHQSKGLGFDVVVFPELQGRSMTTAGALSLTTATDPKSEAPRWVLDMPRRAIAEHTPELDAQVTEIDNQACFNALCALYVALTRAKRALYMVTHNPGRTSTSQSAAAFVKTRLTGEANPPVGDAFPLAGHPCTRLHEAGCSTWFESRKEQVSSDAQEAAPALPKDFGERASMRERLERIEPSSEHEMVTSAALLFEPEMRDILDFGSAIHALFEAVEWLEDADTESILETWLQSAKESDLIKRDVAKQFRDAVMMPSVQEALRCPAGRVELWREKRFEVVLESQWVTGIFDRVTIIRDDSGQALSATILDYKSNQIHQPAQFEKATETYRPQLERYSQALSLILKLPPDAITKQLLFTRTGKIITV